MRESSASERKAVYFVGLFFENTHSIYPYATPFVVKVKIQMCLKSFWNRAMNPELENQIVMSKTTKSKFSKENK